MPFWGYLIIAGGISVAALIAKFFIDKTNQNPATEGQKGLEGQNIEKGKSPQQTQVQNQKPEQNKPLSYFKVTENLYENETKNIQQGQSKLNLNNMNNHHSAIRGV